MSELFVVFGIKGFSVQALCRQWWERRCGLGDSILCPSSWAAHSDGLDLAVRLFPGRAGGRVIPISIYELFYPHALPLNLPFMYSIIFYTPGTVLEFGISGRIRQLLPLGSQWLSSRESTIQTDRQTDTQTGIHSCIHIHMCLCVYFLEVVF